MSFFYDGNHYHTGNPPAEHCWAAYIILALDNICSNYARLLYALKIDGRAPHRRSGMEPRPYDNRSFFIRLVTVGSGFHARPCFRIARPCFYAYRLSAIGFRYNEHKMQILPLAGIFIKELPKTAISGAAYWVNSEKTPCIQISQRFKSNDDFWFTFFHEAYHILEHHEKTMFVDIDNGKKDDIEKTADAYSADKLIAPDEYRAFLAKGSFDKAEIISFAQHINRHPGIVVGRLQHDKHIGFNTHIGLKLKMGS